ncbi:MAG: hypothetical protein ACI9N1_003029 [Flavobacteriales bacterium]|jgi:hypothetical protein
MSKNILKVLFSFFFIYTLSGCKKAKIKRSNEKVSFIINDYEYKTKGRNAISYGFRYSIGSNINSASLQPFYEGDEFDVGLLFGEFFFTENNSEIDFNSLESQFIPGEYLDATSLTKEYMKFNIYFEDENYVDWNNYYHEQPAGSFCVVEYVEMLQVHKKQGNKYYHLRATGTFDCYVWNSDGDSLRLEDGKFNISFSHTR